MQIEVKYTIVPAERSIKVLNQSLFPRRGLEKVGPLTRPERVHFDADEFLYSKTVRGRHPTNPLSSNLEHYQFPSPQISNMINPTPLLGLREVLHRRRYPTKTPSYNPQP